MSDAFALRGIIIKYRSFIKSLKNKITIKYVLVYYSARDEWDIALSSVKSYNTYYFIFIDTIIFNNKYKVVIL
jgi:hypothetical protein